MLCLPVVRTPRQKRLSTAGCSPLPLFGGDPCGTVMYGFERTVFAYFSVFRQHLRRRALL